MLEHDHPLALGMRQIERELWRGLATDLQKYESLIPEGTSEDLRTLAMVYYLALVQTVSVNVRKLPPPEPRIKLESGPYDDDPKYRQMTRERKLIRTADVLTAMKSTFEALRHDLLTVPFSFSEADTEATTHEQLQEICRREILRVMTRFDEEIKQAMESAIRQSWGET